MNKELVEKFLPKCCNVIWKQEYVKELAKLSNKELFSLTIREQSPDDWDGMFTT